jgi:hypothetical protein
MMSLGGLLRNHLIKIHSRKIPAMLIIFHFIYGTAPGSNLIYFLIKFTMFSQKDFSRSIVTTQAKFIQFYFLGEKLITENVYFSIFHS